MAADHEPLDPPGLAGLTDAGFVAPCLPGIDKERIEGLLAQDHFFWLDLNAPSAADVAWLGEKFNLHPLALEDTTHFGQRPKLDNYGDYIFMVFYGARDHIVGDREPLREVHLFISGQYVITVHNEPLPALEEQRAKIDGQTMHSEQFVLYRVLDSLTDSFFPLLSTMDDGVDELEQGIVENPTGDQLQRLFAFKRDLVAMRKVVTPQRDIFARSIDEIAALPGLTLDQRDYFRDVYDHLIRISDLIDTYRDLLSGAMDLYLSTVSNRQNEVMKQLATVGTIFLPLSFITGFFGMNFGWFVKTGIAPTWTFWVLGVGSMALTCVALLAFFKRRGWV
jgi:magnesium transporter